MTYPKKVYFRKAYFLHLIGVLLSTSLFGQEILIYNDDGVSSFCVECLLQELDGHDVQTISAYELKSTSWEKTTSLLIMPGGRDLPYVEKLNGEGNRRIRSFVENGGGYLGICAGAYYGSGYVEFDKDGELEVLGDRELKFFSGTAKGPAYGPGTFDYDSRMGAKASTVQIGSETLKLYLNGGCFFPNTAQDPNIKVLGRYHDIPGHPAAIIECQVGKGKAILSGLHLEIGPDHLIHEEDAQEIRQQMINDESKRKKLFQTVITTSGGQS